MKESKLATILALAALDDSELKSLEQRVNELAEIGFKPEIVEELPEEGNDHTLYLVPQNEPGENPWYQEYLWLQDEWEKIGTTSINFENYYTKDEVDAIDATKENIENKVISLSDESTDIEYPSAKAVKDYVDENGMQIFYLTGGTVYDAQHPFDFKGKKAGIYYFQPGGNGAVNFYYIYDNIPSTKGCVVSNVSNVYPKGTMIELVIITPIENVLENGGMFATAFLAEGQEFSGDKRSLLARSTISYNAQNQTIRSMVAGNYGTLLDVFGNNGNIVYSNTEFRGSVNFTKIPYTSVAPTSNTHLTNKTYVDSNFVKLTGAQTVSGVKTFSNIPKQANTTAPTQDEQFTNKKYVDDAIINNATQYSTMPAPAAGNEGDIIQYTGASTQDYTQGYYYICVSDGELEPTYSWEQINVQPAPNMDDYFFNDVVENWDLLTPEQQVAFAVAVVDDGEGNVPITPEIQNDLNDIVGSEEPIISDMTEEEAIEATNEIIGGGGSI